MVGRRLRKTQNYIFKMLNKLVFHQPPKFIIKVKVGVFSQPETIISKSESTSNNRPFIRFS